MNIKRILCPVDFSNFNIAANAYASMLAKSTGAKIIYLHAFVHDPVYGYPDLPDDAQKEKELLTAMEKTYKPTIDGIESSYVVRFGIAEDQIVHFANEYEVDMIVLGTHGRTGLKRIVMGSVAEAVVRRAECPVLAIKTDSKILQEN